MNYSRLPVWKLLLPLQYPLSLQIGQWIITANQIAEDLSSQMETTRIIAAIHSEQWHRLRMIMIRQFGNVQVNSSETLDHLDQLSWSYHSPTSSEHDEIAQHVADSSATDNFRVNTGLVLSTNPETYRVSTGLVPSPSSED